MAKNTILRDPITKEPLYPQTRKSLLLDDAGNPFTPQSEIPVNNGFAMIGNAPVAVNLTVNGQQPIYDSVSGKTNFALDATNRIIDTNPTQNSHNLVESGGVYSSLTKVEVYTTSSTTFTDWRNLFEQIIANGKLLSVELIYGSAIGSNKIEVWPQRYTRSVVDPGTGHIRYYDSIKNLFAIKDDGTFESINSSTYTSGVVFTLSFFILICPLTSTNASS